MKSNQLLNNKNKTKMNKETIFSLVRMVLTLAGTFFIGKVLIGKQVDEKLWQLLGGVILASASIAWSWFSKEQRLEQWQAMIRQFFAAAGAVAVAYGWLNESQAFELIGLATSILTFVYAMLSKNKTQGLITGEIKLYNLKKPD